MVFVSDPVPVEVRLFDWTKLPDVAAVTLLTCAFASVARRNPTPVSGLWLTGWIMIAAHFCAAIFVPAPGFLGTLANIISVCALVWAAILFKSASVPYRSRRSSSWMLRSLLGAYTLYIGLLISDSTPAWALNAAAILIGVLPLSVALAALRKFSHPLRWVTVSLSCMLSMFLLAYQNRAGGADTALNALLFVVYFGCAIHFWFAYKRGTTGAFITIAGFFLWASVFVVGQIMSVYFPDVHIEGEVWNLPKYVVAVGMILLQLEDQIEHNKYLALHDELTGLPNRRLFQDRLTSAIERARRTDTRTALLLVDLNRFKQVNDTLGHHVGDLLLQRVAEIFTARVRRSDTVARTGGDEFSVILEEPTSREDAESVAQSLMELLDQPLHLQGNLVRTGASIGLAFFPEDARDMETLCIAADLKMYDAKRKSKEISKLESESAPRSHPAKIERQLFQI
jgi:diguanylate cyclase (GGDEF)-like protein